MGESEPIAPEKYLFVMEERWTATPLFL